MDACDAPCSCGWDSGEPCPTHVDPMSPVGSVGGLVQKIEETLGMSVDQVASLALIALVARQFFGSK